MLKFILSSIFISHPRLPHLGIQKDSHAHIACLYLGVSCLLTLSIGSLTLNQSLFFSSQPLMTILSFIMAGAVFGLIKIFIYSFMISSQKESIIPYKSVLMVIIIVNIRLSVAIFFLSLLLPFFSSGLLVSLLFISLGYSLKEKARWFRELYEVNSIFIYWVSGIQWAVVFPVIIITWMQIVMAYFKTLLKEFL